MDEKSLTREEAEQRAALISVTRYDIAVDLTGLLEGEVWASTSTITFACTQPGASTFVDCVAQVGSATLNGAEVDPAAIADGRIQLADLAADNVLVVSCTQPETGSGAGILRTVDPTDGLVYVWTSFEADDARRAWACFDQPDLKAPHAFTVTAPESWTVTSNSAPEPVLDGPDGTRVWSFADTPSLSTYVVVVNAGPFVELREQRGGHSLGLYARQSLRANLERDAPELFDVTEAGLAFFGERFAVPFGQERYDQVFVPNMGGAMENWGCVTWTDSVLWRSTPTYGQRSVVANILLHEMAHMWFGDLVTMQWWDDLWLNEAFASWAATWAQVNATDFDDAEATFLLDGKVAGYRQDMTPATHAIRGAVPDVAQAMANFDDITYVKGESVLGQLVAYVGEDHFVAGLRAYFAEHAWGNTRLSDLMSGVGAAAGLDLDAWTVAWFDRAGTDTLTLTADAVLAASPDADAPRPHRIDIGSYALGDGESDGGLTRVDVRAVTTSGTSTPIEALPAADLHLVNEGALTFAAVRTDPASLRVMLDHAGDLPDPLARAVAVSTAWDMLLKAELSADDVLTCVLGALSVETSPGIVESLLRMAQEVAELWTPTAGMPAQLSRVAAAASALVGVPEHRAPALRTLAATGSSTEDLAVLTAAAADDTDVAWRMMVLRASLGDHDPAAVEALLAIDPDPDAAMRAVAVSAARPDPAAKAEAWKTLFVDRSVPSGSMTRAVSNAFWNPAQADLLHPWCDTYIEEMGRLGGGAMLSVLSLIYGMFPKVGDQAFLDRVAALAAAPDVVPTVRTAVLNFGDMLARMLRARGEL